MRTHAHAYTHLHTRVHTPFEVCMISYNQKSFSNELAIEMLQDPRYPWFINKNMTTPLFYKLFAARRAGGHPQHKAP